jgi:heme-degrading monooxygenase HmoA
MYVRVTMVPLQAGKTSDVTAVFREVLVPALGKLPGFEELLLLTDSASGKAISISIWRTQEEWAASEADGVFQELGRHLTTLVAGAPAREGYELSLHVDRSAEGTPS